MRDQCTPQPDTKTCTKCGETKPLTEFHRHHTSPGGLYPRCKPCRSTQGAAYRLTNHEAVVTRKAAWYRANRDQVMAASKRVGYAWREANPEKSRLLKRTSMAVTQAIRLGALIRPAICEECGDTREIQAAHSDYSRPLDVRWLCRPCHSRWDHADPKLRHI